MVYRYLCISFAFLLLRVYFVDMSESSLQIPERCKDCPFISPVFDSYIMVEAELYMLENTHQLSEYADGKDIEARIDELRPQVERLEDQLHGLRALTVGCVGVKLAQVKFDDEYISDIECRSPMKNIF